MKNNSLIRRAVLTAVTAGTLAGAVLMPVSAYASDGEEETGAAVYVDLPQGWQTKAVTLPIRSTEATVYTTDGNAYRSEAKVFYATFDEGSYVDVTDVQAITVDHNCKLKIKAIYDDGNTVYNIYEIKNFDLESPTVSASVDGELLYISASDGISGVKDITVNGKAFTELGAGQMCVNIKDLQDSMEYIEIYADDVAGNKSKEYKIKNPYFVGEIESGQEDLSLGNPDSVESTEPTKARGTVSDDTVVNGNEGTREFYTVEASGKTFYLIVDKTANQDNVYLLTEAGVNDLLNFVDYNGVDVQNGDVPMYEIPGAKRNVEPEETVYEEEEVPDTKEKKAEPVKSSSASMFVIVVIACIGAAAYYLLKNKKRREDLAEAEEMDSYDIPEDNDGYGQEDTDEEYEDADAEDGAYDDAGDDTDDQGTGYEGEDPGAESNTDTYGYTEADDSNDYENPEEDINIEIIPEEALEGADIMPDDLIFGDTVEYPDEPDDRDE